MSSIIEKLKQSHKEALEVQKQHKANKIKSSTLTPRRSRSRSANNRYKDVKKVYYYSEATKNIESFSLETSSISGDVFYKQERIPHHNNRHQKSQNRKSKSSNSQYLDHGSFTDDDTHSMINAPYRLHNIDPKSLTLLEPYEPPPITLKPNLQNSLQENVAKITRKKSYSQFTYPKSKSKTMEITGIAPYSKRELAENRNGLRLQKTLVNLGPYGAKI